MSRPMREWVGVVPLPRVRLPRKKESQRGVHLRLGLRAVPALIYYFRKLSRYAQVFTRAMLAEPEGFLIY